MDAYLDGLRRCAFSCVIYAGVPARVFPKGGEGKGPSHALGTLYNLRRPIDQSLHFQIPFTLEPNCVAP